MKNIAIASSFDNKNQISLKTYSNLVSQGLIIPISFRKTTEKALLSEIEKGITLDTDNIDICDICTIKVVVPNKPAITAFFAHNWQNLEKADYGGKEAQIGEIRIYGGVAKQKQPDGTWMRYYGDELKSGKITEEAYHKNMVSVKASKIKEILKKQGKKDLATAESAIDTVFHYDAHHDRHKQEIIDKLIKEKVISAPAMTNPAANTPIIEEEEVSGPSLSDLKAGDKVLVQLGMANYQAKLLRINTDGTFQVAIPQKRAVIDMKGEKVIAKIEDSGREIMLKTPKFEDYNKLMNKFEQKKALLEAIKNDDTDAKEVLKMELKALSRKLDKHPGKITEGSLVTYNGEQFTVVEIDHPDQDLHYHKVVEAIDGQGHSVTLPYQHLRVLDQKLTTLKSADAVVKTMQEIDEAKVETIDVVDDEADQKLKTAGSVTVKEDEDKPVIEVDANVEKFDADAMDDDYVSDLIDDDSAGADEINDFKVSDYFLTLSNKKDKKLVNEAFNKFKADRILTKDKQINDNLNKFL